MTSERLARSRRAASAGGHDEQPWLVNSSTTASGPPKAADAAKTASAATPDLSPLIMIEYSTTAGSRGSHVGLSGGRRAPAPVHPEPLPGVLAHPARNHIRHRLHG